jgi:hypothetical protein
MPARKYQLETVGQERQRRRFPDPLPAPVMSATRFSIVQLSPRRVSTSRSAPSSSTRNSISMG